MLIVFTIGSHLVSRVSAKLYGGYININEIYKIFKIYHVVTMHHVEFCHLLDYWY